MTTTTANGATVPVGSDPYALTADLKKAIESVRSIIPISSAALQTDLPGLFPGGVLPEPTFICRTDLLNQPLLRWDGSGWRSIEGDLAKGLVAYSNNPETSVGLGGSGILCDLVEAPLIAGRLYRADYRVDTNTDATNMAIVASMKISATTDDTAAGTDVDDAETFYTAPGASQGKTSHMSFTWRAAETGTFNIKAVLARATTESLYNIDNRKLSVYDCGYQFA